MLAPGVRAAAAEQQHLRDPSCSVPVARGPAEQRETTRPTGKVPLGSARAAPGAPGVTFGGYEPRCARGILTRVFGSRAASPDARPG